MPIPAWLASVWEMLRDLDLDYDPVEQLEARVAALERELGVNSVTSPSEASQRADATSGAAPRTIRI